jgi:colanic acid biosynthesis glycosyl transferase WcaI
MRVLLYSYNYHPEPIGIAPLMTELSEGLVKRGHQVRVVTAFPWYPNNDLPAEYAGKLYEREERNGVTVQRCYVRARQQRSLKNRILFELSFVFFSFFQALKGPRPDIIFLTVPGLPVCVPAALLKQLYGAPIVLNLQDILPDAAIHVGLLKNEKMIGIFRGLERFAYRSAARISVIADGFTKNLLEKEVSPEKIVEISNWVNVDFIKPLDKTGNYFIRENDLEGKFVVLYSGNIALTQPLETLIDAGARLLDIPDIRIVIVGKNEAIARLERYREQKRAENVILLPFQPREKLPEMLVAADVAMVMQKQNVISFNMPSKIQVLLASGRPIIASVPATGTAARAIERSGGGIVVAPENPEAIAGAIRELYGDRERLRILGEKGRQYAVENYSFESALDKYEKLFAEVVLEKE